MNKKNISLRRITFLGLITAVLVVISLVSAFIKTEYIVIQFTTGVFIVFCWLVPGSGMLIVGIIYGAIVDAINLSFITIPATITINALIYLLINFMPKNWIKHLFFIIACLLVFLYIPYQWFITWNGFQKSDKLGFLVIESITDFVQFLCSLVVVEIAYFSLIKTKLKEKIKAQLQ